MPDALRGVELSFLRGCFALMLFSTSPRKKLGVVAKFLPTIFGKTDPESVGVHEREFYLLVLGGEPEELPSGEIFVKSWLFINSLKIARSSSGQDDVRHLELRSKA